MQKIIILGLLFLSLVGCASRTYYPEVETASACYKTASMKDTVCVPVEREKDPVRFHYLRPWQEENLPGIPSTL